jgi:hypothetical protein
VLTASAPAPKKTGLAPEQLTEISRALVPFGFKQEDVQTSINSILSVQPIANSSSTGAVAEILAWLKTSSGRKSGVSRVSSHTDALASLSESTDLAIKPRVTVLAGAEDGEAASAAIYCRLMLQKDLQQAVLACVDPSISENNVAALQSATVAVCLFTSECFRSPMLAAQLATVSTTKARCLTVTVSSDFRVPCSDSFYQSMVQTGAPLASSAAELESKVNGCLDSAAGLAFTAVQVACSFAAVMDIVCLPVCIGQHSQDILRAEFTALASRLVSFGVMLKGSMSNAGGSNSSDNSTKPKEQGWLESSSRYQAISLAAQQAPAISKTQTVETSGDFAYV